MSASFALPNCWQPSPPPSQGARVGGGVLSPTHLPQKRGGQPDPATWTRSHGSSSGCAMG